MAEETIAEENTEPAVESQEDSSDDKGVTSPADETLLAEDAAADQDADKAKDADGDDADSDGEAEPVNYDDLKMPEGIPIEENILVEFKDIAAEMNDGKGLSKEDAQKLVDFRAKTVSDSIGEWENKFSEWRGRLATPRKRRSYADCTQPITMKMGAKKQTQPALSLHRSFKEKAEWQLYLSKIPPCWIWRKPLIQTEGSQTSSRSSLKPTRFWMI